MKPKCEIPPAGWWCSREPGHEGPCAARAIEKKESWVASNWFSLGCLIVVITLMAMGRPKMEIHIQYVLPTNQPAQR